jgi:hypothetical protein
MAKQLTQELAVERMSAAHGGFYNYDNTIYVAAFIKLVVSCPLHGNFNTTFTNHAKNTNPRGCPVCGGIRRSAKKTRTVEDFISRAKDRHGERYGYFDVVYKNTHVKVNITCPEHGVFTQSPEKHISGQGCPICAGRGYQNSERFTKAAIAKHGDTYDYSLVTDAEFSVHLAKVTIKCRLHGVFHQNYSNHLQGQNCPKCAKYGFNSGLPGTLYILQDAGRVKVGITNRELSVRVREVNKPDGNFVVHKSYYYLCGRSCLNHETDILQHLRSLYTNTEGTFDGVTESFEFVDIDSVINYIEKLREYDEKENTWTSIGCT